MENLFPIVGLPTERAWKLIAGIVHNRQSWKELLREYTPIAENTYSKDVYLLATSLEETKSSMDGAIKGVQGWIDCFEGSRLAGIVYGTGAGLPGTVKETEAVREAYELGSKI